MEVIKGKVLVEGPLCGEVRVVVSRDGKTYEVKKDRAHRAEIQKHLMLFMGTDYLSFHEAARVMREVDRLFKEILP